MILRRFMQHIKEQNWFAVALDVLVVIVGIFLGMQVNNWNEEYKTRSLEAALIMNLDKSLETAKRDAVFFRDRLEDNIELLEYTLQNWDSITVKDFQSQIVPFQKNNFSSLFSLTSYSQFFDPEMDLYNSAVSDGSIGLLRDRGYIRKLNRLYKFYVPRINELMTEEYRISQSITEHIASTYGEIFLQSTNSAHMSEGSVIWSDDIYEAFFSNVKNDGTLKYKLAQRLEYKRGRLLLIRQLLENI